MIPGALGQLGTLLVVAGRGGPGGGGGGDTTYYLTNDAGTLNLTDDAGNQLTSQ